MTYLGEPHEAVRRVNEMDAVGGEEPVVEGTRNSVDKTRGGFGSHFLVELGSELGQ